MSWMNNPFNWMALTIWALAMAGAFYLLGHIVFLFEERARRKRRRALQEVRRKAMMNQEERFRTFVNNEEVGK